MKPSIAVGSTWRSIHGREVVEVRRVWDWPGEGMTVRAHPVRGGRPLVADADWFTTNYAPLALPGGAG